MSAESIHNNQLFFKLFANRLGKLWFKLKGSGKFSGTADYWQSRYAAGGNSGSGSYGRLAEHKAEVINRFVAEKGIHSVIEFGCGDGHQLSLANYPAYIGLDVSATAISQCIGRFASDKSKSFFLYQSNAFADHAGLFKADLALSLDVLFHLVEEDIFAAYLLHLFAAGDKYVLIYASNFDAPQQFHEKRRQFTAWVEANVPGWKLLEVIPNQYPFDANAVDETSLSDFYIYTRL